MSEDAAGTPAVSSAQLIERLDAVRSEHAAQALVFDGDGTLWSGDVGEDLFHHATSQRALRAAAEAALGSLGARFGVSTGGDANERSEQLFAAYLDGSLPEREACEMMTWCYAGRTLAELDALVREALPPSALDARRQLELAPVLEWAREAGVACWVVSASPRAVVEHGARLWGFEPERIVASDAVIARGEIQPTLAHPVPYAEQKVVQAEAVLGGATWLGCFGDNVFDLEMLARSRLPVAVRPKAALSERLGEVRGAVRLAGSHRPGILR